MTDFPRTAVLYMGPFNGWGARERGLIREARQAKMIGIEVIVCCPLESYIHIEAKNHGIETFPIRPVKKTRWFGAYREVFNFLHKRHQLTHFHCYDGASLLSVAHYLRRHPEVALVWSIHGTPPQLGRRWWQRVLLARTDRFLLPSSLSLPRLSQLYGVSPHKIAQVGLAIDAREVAWEQPSREQGLVLGVSLPDGPESIVTTEVVARAVSLIHARSDCRIHLLLHNPRDWQTSIWRVELEKKIQELNIAPYVEFVSGEDFSVFVGRLHLSLAAEGSEVPYDQIEICLLAGIPVIHPRNRSYRELLHDITTGLFSYKPRDARELTEKILKLHQTWEEQRQEMRGQREEHSRWHNPMLVREQLQQVYEMTMLRRVKFWRKLKGNIN